MMLRWLQKTGGRPIALMGGGTTQVGDPSGKDEARKILSLEAIAANKEGIKRVFAKFLDFGESGNGALMPDNAEWLTALKYIDFLREVGRHFSVNRMLSMDSVRLRLDRDQELSFIEFNYMCLQAYDFVELNRRYGTALQMGGSDQWGNIVTGIDLGRRMGTAQLYALTSPLLTTASGAKMGKTAQGAIWLEAEMLSVYDYWQFWRNCEDRTSAASSGCSPNCRSTRSPASKLCRMPRSTRRRSSSRRKRPPWCMAARRLSRPRRRPARPSKKARWRRACRRSPSPARNSQPDSAS